MTRPLPIRHVHAPRSRSTRILALRHELGVLDRTETVLVGIARVDGSGAPDPANPHPEGKVPLLLDGDEAIRESAAIVLHLTDRFPEAGLGPRVGEAGRGAYLSWLAWYAGVFEPAYVLQVMEAADHPVARATWRGVPEAVARLSAALADGRPHLLGERYSGADLLVASTYGWFRDAIPDDPAIRAWVDRCLSRPSQAWAAARDDGWLAAGAERAA